MENTKITKIIMLNLLLKTDMTGYQIYSVVKKHMSFFSDISKSSTYYLLDKMNQSKLVSFNSQNNSNKKIYSITSKGKIQLTKLLFEIIEQPVIDPFEIVSFSFDNLDKKEIQQLTQKRLNKYKEYYLLVNELEKNNSKNTKKDSNDNYISFICKRAKKMMDLDIKLFNDLLKDIKNEK